MSYTDPNSNPNPSQNPNPNPNPNPGTPPHVSTPPAGYVPDPRDVADNKVIAILANFGILFFLPLVCCPHSPFARFFSNRGLIVLILGVASGIISTILGFIPVVGWIIGGLLSLAVWVVNLIILILSIIDAASGKTSPLPLVGDIQIIK